MRPHPKFDASGLECEHCIAAERDALKAELEQAKARLAHKDTDIASAEIYGQHCQRDAHALRALVGELVAALERLGTRRHTTADLIARARAALKETP